MAIFVDEKGKGPLKDEKSEVTGINILDDLEKRIEKFENFLNKAKEKMLLKKGKEKMVMEREVIIIEDTDDNPFQVTSDESFDDRLAATKAVVILVFDSEGTIPIDCTAKMIKTEEVKPVPAQLPVACLRTTSRRIKVVDLAAVPGEMRGCENSSPLFGYRCKEIHTEYSNLQTQTSNTLYNAIMEAGSKDHPSMLAPGNYVQWKSRIKRYIDTKPNHELIHYCPTNPPYELGWKEKFVLDSERNPTTTTERVFETYKNVTQDIRDQLYAVAEAVQIIFTWIDNDIYSTVDACSNACEMWKAIEWLKTT
nr:hypothetical protein [Tanacetum cinerariifolium]